MEDIFRLPKDTQITKVLLGEYLDKHRQQVTERYKKLYDAYIGKHDILNEPAKEAYKPDNRIVVNFPKYIVDTMNGFFIGNPIKTVANDEKVTEYVEYLNQYNDQDDNNGELSKLCSIYGRGYEFYFVDEEAELCITYISPQEAFMVYDDTIIEKPLFFVRRYTDKDGIEFGTVYTVTEERNFRVTGGIEWLDKWKPHRFNGVPATEYIENAERIGLFEPVLSMVNAYNKAISEKANDVDYFADAYLKILGTKIENEDVKFIRDSRILNFYGDDAEKITADFMDKPNSDTTQENLLERLERHIFDTSLVLNTSDEKFGTSSGIALQHKLISMSNLFKVKQRKFESGMNRRYKLLFGHPASKVPADAWVGLNHQFSPNIPANISEEADIASKLEGVVSRETQLKVLSIVDNVQTELDKIAEEQAAAEASIIEQAMFAEAAAAENEEVIANEQP